MHVIELGSEVKVHGRNKQKREFCREMSSGAANMY